MSRMDTDGGERPDMLDEGQWHLLLASIHLDKQQINRMVMNYMVVEGYKDAAEHFSQEAGVEPSIDLAAVEHRMQVCPTLRPV